MNDIAEIAIDASIFRAYDIRGIVDRQLNITVVRLIGQALGSEALDRGQTLIATGRDGRLSGPMLSEALIEGLRQSGIDVLVKANPQLTNINELNVGEIIYLPAGVTPSAWHDQAASAPPDTNVDGSPE